MSAINWKVARSVATRFAGTYPLEGTYHDALFAREAPGLVSRAAELAAKETGLPWVGDPEVRVVTRAEWAEANLAAFGRLLASAEQKLEGRGSKLGRRLAARLMGAEVGALVGILGRRVLGQYELVLPAEDGGVGDTVMFVGANVLQMERANEFRPAEFRFWVALHECTHRLQFTGVPWLRGYFLSLVDELVDASTPEEGRLQRLASEMRTAAKEGRPVIGESGLMGLFATPAQRDALESVQALMSLLEGHGHVVMDRIGGRELVTQHRMSRVLKMRRKDPRMAAFLRITGLEMKMRQYEEGEAFIHAVERAAGFEALDHCWEGPEALPRLDEIRDPQRWLQRVA
ncbi:MAG: zinc-dependent metalloprotease [Acidimicrobiia bacterium]|nr:zinc-dependent metalloprotease [Acidimicrobiia bacterium]